LGRHPAGEIEQQNAHVAGLDRIHHPVAPQIAREVTGIGECFETPSHRLREFLPFLARAQLPSRFM
jgi:hypothetical protein